MSRDSERLFVILAGAGLQRGANGQGEESASHALEGV
jgi:hypothetical protein